MRQQVLSFAYAATLTRGPCSVCADCLRHRAPGGRNSRQEGARGRVCDHPSGALCQQRHRRRELHRHGALGGDPVSAQALGEGGQGNLAMEIY